MVKHIVYITFYQFNITYIIREDIKTATVKRHVD